MLPQTSRLGLFHLLFTLEKGLALSGLMFIAGLALGAVSISVWVEAGLGPLIPEITMRYAIPPACLMIAGAQVALFSFVISLIERNDVAVQKHAMELAAP